MKETNMEHFRGEIEAFISAKSNFGKSKADGTINHCHIIGCDNCEFIEKGMSCDTGTIKWLMSEYKPEPVLTAREKHFVECINDGFIVRDENPYRLHWFSKKPRKTRCGWTADSITQIERIRTNAMFDVDMFPFITWEDEEPWSVADLRKLKALEYNPEDVAFKKGGVADD